MSYEIPEKLKKLEAYPPVTGQDKYRLNANESFLSLPYEIRYELSNMLPRLEFNRYPDPYATELCEKFGDYYHVPADLVVAGNGSDELLYLLATCFGSHGDTLLVTSPDFSLYELYGTMAGMNVEVFDKGDSMRLDPDAFIAKAKEVKPEMVIFSNPCNPTSLGSTGEDVLKIVSALEDSLVIVDEAYMEFADGSVITEVQKYSNLMVLKTFSKAFGLAGARLGFAVSNKTVTDALKAAKAPYNVNCMTQQLGCILLDHPAYLEECILQISEARDYLFGMLQALAGSEPKIKSIQNTRTNFVFMEVEDPEGVQAKLKEQGIAIRKLGKYLRISTGSIEDNEVVIQALKDCLKGETPCEA